ncbi:DUF1639 family protein [Senna tora]|uniref:DUF1639 family protein n=1 Tax=Senna tora TaxID=362788 RepID=A0A834T5H0_9FABA|nr:DUF1639 family protein [Senna tora]
MATAPVKSQPLHNFSLPFLKWGGKNQTNTTHRFRRPAVSGDSSSSHAILADHTSELESGTRHPRVGSRTARNRFGFSIGEKRQDEEEEEPVSVGRGRYYNETDDEGGDRKQEGEAAEEAVVQKPWNLRPRKSMFSSRGAVEIGVGGSSSSSRNGELQETVTAVAHGENPPPQQPKSLRLRGFAEMQSLERKKEKRKFWIALSREEIEEDIFVMTGSRPARRPKKRPKNVQKQLDSVFPGLWLVGVTADVYRVAETPAKAWGFLLVKFLILHHASVAIGREAKGNCRSQTTQFVAKVDGMGPGMEV